MTTIIRLLKKQGQYYIFLAINKKGVMYIYGSYISTQLISFGIKYWFLFLIAVVIAAIGSVMLLYYRNKDNHALTKNQVRVLFVLRLLSFLTISFLLLSPFIRNFKKIIQRPIIILAWDNSFSSISTPDSLVNSRNINLFRNDLLEELNKNYSVVEYSFGEKVNRFDEFTFSDKKSDYSEILSHVANSHINENIGALIIGGDGIYNEGKNPVNLINEINFPVYTIGFGDTTEIMDSRINNLRVNRTSFSGNRFPVEIDVKCTRLEGVPLKLSVFQNGVELAGTIITPTGSNFFHTEEFILESGTPGLKHFEVKIEAVLSEKNVNNNIGKFVINVLKNKQKILILSEGPHPDIGAIKNTLEQQISYEVSVFTEEPYPSMIMDYNLVILNQLPTSGKSISEVMNLVEKHKIPTLFIVGNKTFLPQLNVIQTGAEIVPLAGSKESAQALLNNAYTTFKISEEFRKNLPQFPPLLVPFADFQLDPQLLPLFYQKIMNLETSKPLVATGNNEGRKTGFIFGEGIWRWRLFNYYSKQNHNIFNELINKLVQYLSIRENEDNFMIDYNPVYSETDNVIITAEVYNDAYEQITSEEVIIDIKDSENNELNFTFDVQANNYYLNAGNLPTGDYTFSSVVKLGNEIFEETGNFTVVPVNIENLSTRANHNMLYQLANSTNGKFFLPADGELIVPELKNNNSLKATSYMQEMVYELLNLKWLFFVFLLLLSLEWFLRKFWGIY